MRTKARQLRGPTRLWSVAPIARLAAPTLELGRDHARIVEDEQVAGPQQSRQIPDAMVGEATALDQQQPGAVARARRPQRDPIGRELEIEQVDAHRARGYCGVRLGRGLGGLRWPP